MHHIYRKANFYVDLLAKRGRTQRTSFVVFIELPGFLVAIILFDLLGYTNVHKVNE